MTVHPISGESLRGIIMKTTVASLSNELSGRGIRPSQQRIKILEYLKANHCHPTVDQIYTSLQPEIPTLSRTTVYNTLNEFIKNGLVRAISIEETESRYDILVHDHGHFKCDSCGTIYNFNVNIEQLAAGDLKDFQINDRNVYFKGVCPRCLQKISPESP